MSQPQFRLEFTLAGRRLFVHRLNVAHWDAYEHGATTSDFVDRMPATDIPEIEGYLVHSLKLAEPLNFISDDGKHIQYLVQEFPRYTTRIHGSFEDFLASKSSKTRSTLRRKVRKFIDAQGSGPLDWRQYSSAEDMRSFFAAAAPLAQRTYQARLFDGALPSNREFIAEALDEAARGKLRAYLLFLSGEAVAYLYAPIRNGRMIYAYLGYDERAAALSPGTVLQYLVHESLFNNRIVDTFDFTEGAGAHKALFSTDADSCCNLLFVNNTRGNRFWLRAHRAWNRSVAWIRDLAERLKWKTYLRRLVRR